MKSKLTFLKNAGCNIDGALERFLQDEDFYMECYQQTLNDSAFEQLGEDLEAHQFQDAFNHAHNLKGVLANMGITPIYNLIIQIVDALYQDKGESIMPVYTELMQKREEFRKVI